jgi:hypothetical protein
MRQTFIRLSILFFSFATIQSCKKDTMKPADITGNWDWIETSTDAAPGPLNPLTPLNSGVTQSLNFSANSWTLTKNNLPISTGTYRTTIATNTSGQSINSIHFYRTNNSTDSVTYYSINKDALTFSYDYSGTVGSGATNYVRK